MEENEHIQDLLKLNSELTAIEKAEIKEQIMLYINHLLVHDFNRLIQILYKVDVNEARLKELLRANPQTDAATIIAELLIERQEEKIKSKEAFRPNSNIQEEDKW